MAFETVTGYCWPQSVEAGRPVGAAPVVGGRPAGRRSRSARVGARARRWCSPSTGVPADDHPTPPGAAQDGCGWPAARELDVDRRRGARATTRSSSRSTSTASARRSHAFFVVRPPAGAPTAPILLALSTNTWHAYNDFGGRNLYTGGTHGLAAAADGARATCTSRRARAAG